MMCFTYIFRDKSGAKCEATIEAASREMAFAALRAQGIMPINVFEGRRISSRVVASGTGHQHGGLSSGRALAHLFSVGMLWRVSAFAAIIIAVCGALWWFLIRSEPTPYQTPSQKAKVVSREGNSVSTTKQHLHSSGGGKRVKGDELNLSVVSSAVGSSTNGMTFSKPMALPPPPTNRTFKTTTEQVLGHVFTTRLGDMPFPVPRLPDEELAKIKEILERDVPLKDSDDAHVLDTKETVSAAKKEFATFLSEGGKPEEFLSYYHEVLRKAFEEYSMACNACEKVKEEQPEIYKEFLDTVNRRLAAKGIKQVVPEPDDEQESVDTRSADESDQKTKGTQ